MTYNVFSGTLNPTHSRGEDLSRYSNQLVYEECPHYHYVNEKVMPQ